MRYVAVITLNASVTVRYRLCSSCLNCQNLTAFGNYSKRGRSLLLILRILYDASRL
ncbi:glutamyl-tRNA reductase, partial [Escherichia coli]|nr:glutamyl-tRNA reductase [Escherichia coli]